MSSSLERRWWLSSERMTIGVTTQDGRIVRAAPIAAKFIGQPLANLVAWMRAQGGLETRMLK